MSATRGGSKNKEWVLCVDVDDVDCGASSNFRSPGCLVLRSREGDGEAKTHFSSLDLTWACNLVPPAPHVELKLAPGCQRGKRALAAGRVQLQSLSRFSLDLDLLAAAELKLKPEAKLKPGRCVRPLSSVATPPAGALPQHLRRAYC